MTAKHDYNQLFAPLTVFKNIFRWKYNMVYLALAVIYVNIVILKHYMSIISPTNEVLKFSLQNNRLLK